MSLVDLFKKIKYKYEHKELWRSIYNRMPGPFRHLFFLINIQNVQAHYNKVIKLIKKKISNGEKVTVGFFVIYDTMFSAKTIFEKMLLDDFFDPYIVIAPDVDSGEKHMLYHLQKAYETCIQLYNNEKVLLGYNNSDHTFIDYSDRFDIVYFSRPYDSLTHQFFRMEYLIKKNILTFHTNYSISSITTHTREKVISPFMNFAWKVFVENQACYDEYRQYGPIKGKNVSLVGYCKLDEYSKQKEIKLDRKRIILAPHHSIINDTKKYLYLSNFLEYADLFLNLPKKYPEIDFIFRPHPLLFERLSRDTFWGEEKTQAYFKELISNPNVIYSDGDFYYDIFMNSDAMIHDCGSFVAEYLVTGHPCCYMLRDYTQFTQFGIECLDYYYKAFNEKDILDFIDNVVIGGIDVQKGERECFVDKYIKINYPDVSGKIIKEIKDAIVANP